MKPVASLDLDHILDHTLGLWEEMGGNRIFVTGATGFFGCWLIESLLAANDRLNLGVSAVVLTRSPEAFRRKAPHLAAHPGIQLLAGDVRTFAFPEGEFPDNPPTGRADRGKDRLVRRERSGQARRHHQARFSPYASSLCRLGAE